MNVKRLNSIDIAKGIAIILVVIGHTSTHLGIEKVIYQFHMPLFFILSGFFYQDNYIKAPLVFLLVSLKRLYAPFVINGLRLFFIGLLMTYLILGSTGFSFLGGLKYILLIILGLNSPQFGGGAFWFLRALFMVRFLYLFIILFSNKIENTSLKNCIVFMSVFIFLIIGYKTQFPYSISSSFIALFFYYMGNLYAKNQKYINLNGFLLIPAIAFVIGSSYINTVDLAYNTYTYFSLFILSSICGTYVILFVSEKIKQNYILEYIGQKSLSIMIFHFLSFVTINLVIVLLFDLPIERILDYPTIKEYRWWWLLYSAVGVIAPLFIEKIIVSLEKKLPRYLTNTFWFEKLNTKIIK
ncbi:acyltransferase family protein [Flavobacterium sp. 120]|uniref:acyltransferase family protein n=1 Tax=Flavobacterium sp. 120 TaxID=2135626 RepID=UPI0013142EEA|nr:acyltransferase family protein [Flavobacterium sp. 120]